MKGIFFSLLLLVIGQPANACEFTHITFDFEFEMARLNGCKKLSDTSYLLTIQPENRPVNHSPWYAFKIRAQTPKEIEINIRFDQERPRYLPKISENGVDWRNLSFTVHEDVMTFHVNAKPNAQWIAGQELFGNQDYERWVAALNEKNDITSLLLGKSTQGRPINALISSEIDNKEWLVLLGRQHPPEVTGVLAMLPFTERMFSTSPLAQKFRKRFNILVVPNLNPDGVSNGHWRHNIQGIDLNRDWINFSQAETRLVRDKLNDIVAKGGKMVMAVDFHSTQQDVFYTMPHDYGIAPAMLVEDWLGKLKTSTASSFVVQNKPGSSPGRGVFKQYFADTFKVHAITYEMGDNTERNMINHVANQAADSLMQTLLATEPQAFYLPKKKH